MPTREEAFQRMLYLSRRAELAAQLSQDNQLVRRVGESLSQLALDIDTQRVDDDEVHAQLDSVEAVLEKTLADVTTLYVSARWPQILYPAGKQFN